MPLFAQDRAARAARRASRLLRIFIACIALGVAAIAGVNSVARALTESISAEGRVILGGDLAFSLIHREATPDERAFLAGAGEVGEIATMRAMLRRADERGPGAGRAEGGRRFLPARRDRSCSRAAATGRACLRQATASSARWSRRRCSTGSDLALGDRVMLGEIELELRDVIRSEPDRLSERHRVRAAAIVSLDALRASGLVREGSLITWTYRLRMPEGANGTGAMGRLRAEARRALSRKPAGASARATTPRRACAAISCASRSS